MNSRAVLIILICFSATFLAGLVNSQDGYPVEEEIPPECPGAFSFLPHRNCSKYWMCDNFVPLLMECSFGLYFNPRVSYCDHASNVPECVGGTNSPPLTTTVATTTTDSTSIPTEPPTDSPTEPPTDSPTEPPTDSPTEPPTDSPTEPPTDSPTEPPTDSPTEPPTDSPTEPPTDPPTEPPTDSPTEPPTDSPTEPPTDSPTEPPTDSPTEPPTDSPTEPPTDSPTEPPTDSHTEPPTESPTEPPTDSPTEPPTDSPTEPPTDSTTEPPTDSPTEPPTDSPTEPPTDSPTEPPTDSPTESPTDSPTEPPTNSPTEPPTDSPTEPPTDSPTEPPTDSPTEPPTTTPAPPSTTPPFEFECPSNDGIYDYPYSGNCSKYIRCIFGDPVILSCVPGYKFDKNDLRCKPGDQAYCTEEICPGDGSYFELPHDSNCSLYYFCNNGNLYTVDCGVNYYYDEVLKGCALAESATCHSECPKSGIAYLPIRATGCRWYKTCYDGESFNIQCQSDWVYHPDQLRCLPPTQYTCPYAAHTFFLNLF